MQIRKWEPSIPLKISYVFETLHAELAWISSLLAHAHEARQLILLSSEILLVTLKSGDN